MFGRRDWFPLVPGVPGIMRCPQHTDRCAHEPPQNPSAAVHPIAVQCVHYLERDSSRFTVSEGLQAPEFRCVNKQGLPIMLCIVL
jgi:hypothetical protein